jgi:hypothetical protein
MTPHRITSLQIPAEPTIGVLAGIIALLGSFWNFHVVLALLFTVVAGITDLWAGARRAKRIDLLTGEDIYKQEILDQGLTNKLFLLFFHTFLGMVFDSFAIIAGGAFDLGVVAPFKIATPFTFGAIIFRLMREVSSIVRNVEKTPGASTDSLWPVFIKMIDVFRIKINAPGTTGVELKRWSDIQLTPEQIERLKKIADEEEIIIRSKDEHSRYSPRDGQSSQRSLRPGNSVPDSPDAK